MTMKRTVGFTLIELMITVAIVGILTAIAYPSYQSQIRKTRRADAEGAVTALAAAMERFYVTNGQYTKADGTAPALGAGGIFPSQAPLDGGTKYYDLSIVDLPGDPATITPTSYTLLATPIAGGPQAGDGPLRLDATGARGWDKNNDDSFAHPWGN